MQDDREEKTLSQEGNMRSESELSESDEKNEEKIDEKDQKQIDESADIQEDDEELQSGDLLPKYGCLKGCLIPIFGIVIIIIAIAMIIHSKSGTINEWLIVRIVSNTQEKILTDLPEGIDKKAVELTFDNVRSAIKNNRIDEQEVKTAIKEYLQATKGLVTPERKKIEIERLILRLNKSVSGSE